MVGLKGIACVYPSEKIVITISHLINSLDRDLKCFLFFTIEHILKPDKIYQSTTQTHTAI